MTRLVVLVGMNLLEVRTHVGTRLGRLLVSHSSALKLTPDSSPWVSGLKSSATSGRDDGFGLDWGFDSFLVMLITPKWTYGVSGGNK